MVDVTNSQNGGKSNGSLASSICCCSMMIKYQGLVARFDSTPGYSRFYSTPVYQNGRRTIDSLGRNCLKIMDSFEKTTLSQWMNAFSHKERKRSYVHQFGSCYRQIYPSKKRKVTFKIPKKPPYIPAVYQKRTRSYTERYKKVEIEPKGRRLQWPPLYPPKRKEYTQPNPSENKNKSLPSWLLPLYSCKACNTSDTLPTSQAHFSGGAFRRRMEIIESIKKIRASQHVSLNALNMKGTKKDKRTPVDNMKPSNAVEALKQKIDSMQDYLTTMKNMEANSKEYQSRLMTDGTEFSAKVVKEAFARIYETDPITQERRSIMGIGAARPKCLDKPFSGASNSVTDQCFEKCKGLDVDTIIWASKNKHDGGVAQTREVESNSKNQAMVNNYPTTEATNSFSRGQIHKESEVMMKQPSCKESPTQKLPKHNEPTKNHKKQQILNIQNNNKNTQNQGSPRRQQVHEEINSTSLFNHRQSRNIRIRETKTVEDGGKTVPYAWTVESLKSRINVMKIKNTQYEPCMKKAEDMSLARNAGEAKPIISHVAMRSFPKEARAKHPRQIQYTNAIKVHLGYQRAFGRRNFSTFRPTKSHQPVTRALMYNRRSIFVAPYNMNKKQDWVRRIRKCFFLKKVKGSKWENWKNSPREITHEKKEVQCKSPAPILCKPKDLGDNHTEQKTCNPPEIMLGDKVNLVVLNAEQRILASLSTTKPSPEASKVPVMDIENKIRRAKNKVNIMPWLKRSTNTDTLQKLPPVRGSYKIVENEESHESGYEWILRNRDTVEELKRQSLSSAGKSLVPAEVKNSINKYKLPLKAEIARYRKRIDQKCSYNLYVYSTSKRWYSTCCAGKQTRLLSSSDVVLVTKRGVKTIEFHKKNSTLSKLLGRARLETAHSDILVRPNLRQHNQGVPNDSCSNIDAPHENAGEEKRLKRWTWKVRDKTRAFTPKTPTSTSKILGTSMAEMSPHALKKQVEELKRLIKKAREEAAEKTNESSTDSLPEYRYEARLKRLVKAARNNAQKIQIVDPKYTSGNHMMKEFSDAKKNRAKPMIESNTTSENSKHEPEASVLKTLFKKKIGQSKSMADEILHQNNLSSFQVPDFNKKTENTISKAYLKLKLLVEAVGKKSGMLDPINEVKKLLPSNSLKGSISTGSMSHSSASISMDTRKPEHVVKSEGAIKQERSPVIVQLKAKHTPTSSNTIQLWKGEAKPQDFNFLHEKEPTYGELLLLFTKAKDLFYYQLPDNEPSEAKLGTLEKSKENKVGGNKNILTQNELNKNRLRIREDVSSAARAVSQLKNNPLKELESQAGSSSLRDEQQKDSGVNALEYLLTKSKMIPVELIKSDGKINCDQLRANGTAKFMEHEDICRQTSSQTNPTDNRLANQMNVECTMGPPNTNFGSKAEKDSMAWHTKLQPSDIKSNQQESKNHTCLETKTLLFQKPLAAWESLKKNLYNGVGRGIFGNAADIPNNIRHETRVVTNERCSRQQQNTGKYQTSVVEISNLSEANMEHFHFHDNNKQSQNSLLCNSTSNGPEEAGYNLETVYYGRTVSNCDDTETNQPKDQYIRDCIESMKPLEETVNKYKNYYRSYFAEDVVSGYEHLYQVYESMNKLGTAAQYQSMDKTFVTELEAGKKTFGCSSKNILEKAVTLIDGKMEDLKSQRSVTDSDGQMASQIKKPDHVKQLGAPAISTGTHASMSAVSGGHYALDINTEVIKPIQDPTAPAKSNRTGLEPSHNSHNGSDRPKPVVASCNSKHFINSSEHIKEEIQVQRTKVLSTRTNVSRDTQPASRVNGKDESANFEELLTQDPTLNPDVVKNLKLPVILSDDCGTEKNWYTKLHYGKNRHC